MILSLRRDVVDIESHCRHVIIFHIPFFRKYTDVSWSLPPNLKSWFAVVYEIRLSETLYLVRSIAHPARICQCKILSSYLFRSLLSGVRGFLLALSAAGQASLPWVQYETCLDLGRVPRRCSAH